LALLPQEVVDRIPGAVIAGLYTAIAYQLMKVYQETALARHQRLGGRLYSGWNAFGVGLGSLLGTLLLTAATVVTLNPHALNTDGYNSGLERLNRQEARALEYYNLDDDASDEEVVTFLKETGIPAWKECLQILDELDQEKDLTSELKTQNEQLREYVAIRLEIYQTTVKFLSGEGDEEKLTQQLKDLYKKLAPHLE
jgi:hypothetical protein